MTIALAAFVVLGSAAAVAIIRYIYITIKGMEGWRDE